MLTNEMMLAYFLKNRLLFYHFDSDDHYDLD